MSALIPSLDEWVNTATEKLSLPAKARIALEIKAHFDDSVQKRQKEGLADAEAQVCALADLGDAKAEGRRFRKYHLTESEAKRLEKKLSSYGRWSRNFGIHGLLYGICLPSILLFCFFLKQQHVPLLLPALMGLSWCATQTMAWWVVSRGHTRPRLRLLFSLEAISWLVLLMFVGLYGLLGSWWPGIIVLVVMGSPIVWWDTLSLWLKTFRMDDVWQEIPPRDGAIEAS
jgi:hypothetical protein